MNYFKLILFLILLLVLFLYSCNINFFTNIENMNNMELNDYSQGIKKSDIPKGKEHLYILKSKIVPPVCPACPPCPKIYNTKKCTPCPPCGRCPEPSFDCIKVPNYSSPNLAGSGGDGSVSVPRPILSNFSQFGM